MTKGILITLEGIHGAGKSTVINTLLLFLKSRKLMPICSADQMATDIGRQIREINLNSGSEVDLYTETFLVAAARREAFIGVIRPQLSAGMCVISERYIDSFFAFGYARGMPEHFLELVARSTCDEVEPDLTLLLDLPADIALSRIGESHRHRVEREPLEFHKRLREGYLRQAERNPSRVVVIDSARPAIEVTAQVEAVLATRLDSLRTK